MWPLGSLENWQVNLKGSEGLGPPLWDWHVTEGSEDQLGEEAAELVRAYHLGKSSVRDLVAWLDEDGHRSLGPFLSLSQGDNERSTQKCRSAGSGKRAAAQNGAPAGPPDWRLGLHLGEVGVGASRRRVGGAGRPPGARPPSGRPGWRSWSQRRLLLLQRVRRQVGGARRLQRRELEQRGAAARTGPLERAPAVHAARCR